MIECYARCNLADVEAVQESQSDRADRLATLVGAGLVGAGIMSVEEARRELGFEEYEKAAPSIEGAAYAPRLFCRSALVMRVIVIQVTLFLHRVTHLLPTIVWSVDPFAFGNVAPPPNHIKFGWACTIRVLRNYLSDDGIGITSDQTNRNRKIQWDCHALIRSNDIYMCRWNCGRFSFLRRPPSIRDLWRPGDRSYSYHRNHHDGKSEPCIWS